MLNLYSNLITINKIKVKNFETYLFQGFFVNRLIVWNLYIHVYYKIKNIIQRNNCFRQKKTQVKVKVLPKTI